MNSLSKPMRLPSRIHQQVETGAECGFSVGSAGAFVAQYDKLENASSAQLTHRG